MNQKKSCKLLLRNEIIEANIIWGAQIDESLENTIRTTIVVSGISESKDSNSITDDDFEDSQELLLMNIN